MPFRDCRELNGAANFHGTSLGKSQLSRIDFQQILFCILLKFRQHLCAVAADIEGIIFQVGVLQCSQKIVCEWWREGPTSNCFAVYIKKHATFIAQNIVHLSQLNTSMHSTWLPWRKSSSHRRRPWEVFNGYHEKKNITRRPHLVAVTGKSFPSSWVQAYAIFRQCTRSGKQNWLVWLFYWAKSQCFIPGGKSVHVLVLKRGYNKVFNNPFVFFCTVTAVAWFLWR